MTHRSPRNNLALTLSGGGLRATLFHLGVLRRLAVAGELDKVRALFAVSGGSIVAAHARLNWERYRNPRPPEAEDPAQELLDLCQRDLRGRVVRRSVLCWLLLLPFFLRFVRLAGFKGWLKLNVAPVDFLIAEYDRFFRGAKLPARKDGLPSLHLLATSLNTGEICVFENDRFLVRRRSEKSVPAQRAPVAVAVAASSAYPALFAPLQMDSSALVVRREQFRETHFLSDGGLFDNLGVMELLEYERETGIVFDEVIVSDAGAAMSAEIGISSWGLFRRGIRTTDILMSRMSDGVLSRMEGNGRFRRLSIHRLVPGARFDENTQTTIGSVRTDLDFFTERERSMIANHGYQVAGELFPGAAPDPIAWLPGANSSTVDEGPLEGSQSPNLWGLLNWRDWCSYAVLAISLAWVVMFAYGVSYPSLYRSYAAYKNSKFIEQCTTAANLIKNPPANLDGLRMREYWQQDGHTDLSFPIRFFRLHRLTGLHQALAERVGMPGPFPRLERPGLVTARENGNVVAYMHLIGKIWNEELHEEFSHFRDESYLQVIRITEELAARSQPGGEFDGRLLDRFYLYFWGRLLPVESLYKVKGPDSVETGMVNFRNALLQAKEAKLEGPTSLVGLRDELRRRIMQELRIGNSGG